MAKKKENSKVPFYYEHVWKNVLLLLLSIATAPFTVAFIVANRFFARLQNTTSNNPKPSKASEPHDRVIENGSNHSSTNGLRKTILVTGVSMTKGLSIARVLSASTTHRIIGADTSSLAPGRFSRSLAKFYRLTPPAGSDAEPYVDSILAVLSTEKVDLWISCSSVIAAVEDGQVVRLAEAAAKKDGRRFEAVQFREDVVERFHEKDQFIEYIQSLDLTVPESYRCTSTEDALKILLQNTKDDDTAASNESNSKSQYILKPIGVDDHARAAMMTLLPFPSAAETRSYVDKLAISATNPFQLQRFIRGREYCTHALVIRGTVRAFTSCPSLELLMHYEPLGPHSELAQAMLQFTKTVAKAGGADFTGHLSFDFLVEEGKDGRNGGEVKLYPIESNPRAHTAVVLFQDTPEMADAYLSIFEEDSEKTPGVGQNDPVFPRVPTYSYYWIGHDLVTYGILPMLDLLFGSGTKDERIEGIAIVSSRVVFWRDGTYAFDDPWPVFVLYHVYWPSRFVKALWSGKQWSRINVSTTKMFEG